MLNWSMGAPLLVLKLTVYELIITLESVHTIKSVDLPSLVLSTERTAFEMLTPVAQSKNNFGEALLHNAVKVKSETLTLCWVPPPPALLAAMA